MSSKAYFNQVAPKWEKMRTEFFPEQVREKAYAVAEIQKGEQAADIGAGTGFIAEGLIQKGLRVIAVDQSETMLEELKKRFDEIDCRLGNEDNLPILSATINYAFANMYLHHVENPKIAIKEMARIVQTGGKVVITDLDEHQFEFLRTEQYDRWLGFKREDVRQWFIDAGLKNVIVDCVDSKCNSDSNQGSEHASITIFVASGEK